MKSELPAILSKFRPRAVGKRSEIHTNPMQRAVDAFFSGDHVLVQALARMVVSKLEQQGAVIAEQRMGWVEGEIRDRLRNKDGLTWEHPFVADFPEAQGSYNIEVDSDELNELSGVMERAVAAAVQEVLESLFNLTLEEVRDQMDEAVARQSEELQQFRERLASRWAKPLRLFAVELGLAIQFGGDMTQWLRSKSSQSDSALIEALLRLHARACQIAGEVEVLLRAGFADGALSRWRTLHEVATVALFLQERGNDVAQRYLDHLTIDSYDMARKHKAASLWPSGDAAEKEIKNLEGEAAALQAKYGKEFGEEYGWASETLKNPRPNFAVIEKAVNFEKLRPFYKLASSAVHAGPKGAFWKLGLLSGQADVLLAGPSNSGLAEAGRLSAMSLARISMALMMVHTAVDSVVWVRVILKVSHEVEDEFINAERRLEDEEGLLRPRRMQKKSVEDHREKASARLRRRLNLR